MVDVYRENPITGEKDMIGSMPFGEISLRGNTDEVAIAALGQANKKQVTNFDTNGPSNGDVTPDHTNDHITIGTAGKYLVTISIGIDSVAGSAAAFFFSAYVNNGATEVTNIHTHRSVSAGGGQSGSVSLNGICDCSKGDTLELWVWNGDNTQNIVVENCTFSVVQIGG